MTVAEAQTVAAVLEEKEVEEGGGDGGRQGRGSGTGVQNNQESRRKYWATRSSIHSFARWLVSLHHSLIHLLHTARFAGALHYTHSSLARSLTHSRARGKVNF